MPLRPEDRQLPEVVQKTAKPSRVTETAAKAGSHSSEQDGRPPPNITKETANSDNAPDAKKLEETEKVARRILRDADESHPKEGIRSPRKEATDTPLETVLHIEAPTAKKSEEHKTHLHAPPYIHHFDTYTLVNDLGKGGFTQDQSITIMKAIRSLLAVNLDVAREELVSKSNVENVCLQWYDSTDAKIMLTVPLKGDLPLPRSMFRIAYRDSKYSQRF